MTTGRARTPTDRIRAAFDNRLTRREGDRELPLGPKAERTRAAVLAAAAQEFATNGYLHTTVADVAAAAGVSLGTVYQYFRDRADLVAAMCQSSVSDMLVRTDTVWRVGEGLDGLRRVLANFVSSYAETAAYAAVWEEVAQVEPELADLRRELGRIFTGSVARELLASGIVPADDAQITATALTGMVDRYCYVTYVFDPPAGGPPSPEHSAEVLAKLWAAALGIG
jgi:AcrR family transcriptional regulator